MNTQKLEIVIFHVSHINNSISIQTHGLLSRAEVQRRGIQFVDIADKNLNAEIQNQKSFYYIDAVQQTIQQINLKLSDYVPFYFIRPVHRPDIVPPNVYRWQKQYPNQLDYWILKPAFLQDEDLKNKYFICIGHWNSTWYGGPLFLIDFKTFVDLITNPSIRKNMSQKVANYSGRFIRTFENDIPDILQGNIVPTHLGPLGRYGHLMESSIFTECILPGGPKEYLRRLSSTEEMKDLPPDWKVII